MALGRLQASLAQATNDITVAAANINFDFTLVKCEAPKEYHDLGNALSKKRKNEAEIGQAHITARRLGALFEGICPSTPNLIRAYGLRASEIAAYAKDHFAEPSDSIFAEQSGIDGTSIWAAATSSPAAMHIQLLSCMLARVWNAQQATSVWYELVKGRRKEVAGKYEDGETLHFANLTAAAQATISRSNLADWDASARAWLRTADRCKSRAQQQLKLIVANVNISVNNDMAVYSSVIAAWKSALESMEKIVSGMPQATNSGPPLLALSSWHLYPDLLAVGKKEVLVRFDDGLISPGGRLTIGLTSEDWEGRGVYWSLSLAHLNFYGRPVASEGQFNATSERLSFTQFTLAIFGTIMGAWNVRGSTINAAAELFSALEDFLARTIQSNIQGDDARNAAVLFFQSHSHWWRILSNAARSILDATGAERDDVQKLVNLGLRRSSKFIPRKEKNYLPFFGLCDPSRLVALMNGNSERIAFLRSMMERRYSHDNPPSTTASLVIRMKGPTPESAQYLTLFPRDRNSGHHRWLSDQSQQVEGESWSLITDLESHMPDGKVMHHCFTDVQTGFRHTLVSIYGDVETAAICQDPHAPVQHIPFPDIETTVWCLKNDKIDVLSLLAYLNTGMDPFDPLSATTQALSAAFTFYRSIPDATLDVKALNAPLFTSAWAKTTASENQDRSQAAMLDFQYGKKDSIGLDRCSAFSCIAYLGAGVDIDPSLFESVFALAHEDSLYIAMQLVCDPWENPAPFELRRVLGNVGRPGITLLIPPTTQMTRPADSSSWRFNTTTAFDGSQENCFQSTSLHLSFTEYYVPVHLTGEQQNQDGQVFYLESYVSVYDSGKWVADIDILQALKNPMVVRASDNICSHNPAIELTNFKSKIVEQGLASAESWHDILDPPLDAFVVRAHGSWVARLGTLALLLQILPPTNTNSVVICSGTMCWPCEIHRSRMYVRNFGTSLENYPAMMSNRAYIY